jgi:TatD DNase family protein
MVYYDAHTHLNTEWLYENRHNFHQQFIDIWWKAIVTVWMNPDANNKAIELAQATQQSSCPIYATVWIHPYEIGHGTIQTREDIDQQLMLITAQLDSYTQEIVAVGEWWIDAHYPGYDRRKELQWYAFKKQCDLARHYKLPIVIHSRSNFADTYDIIKHYGDCNVYFHCRWYGPDELAQLMTTLPHLRVWFCGNLTYPKAHQLQASLHDARQYQQSGQCNILFETDAPYLAPQHYRWQKNHPALIMAIYEYAATYLHIDHTALQQRIEDNMIRLYSLTA